MTLSIHASCSHRSTYDKNIFFSGHNLSCTCCSILHVDGQHGKFHIWYLVSPLVVYQYQSAIPVLLVFFRNVCHANPNANKKFVRSSTYNDTLTAEAVQYIHCNIVSICTYKSWYCPRFCILKSSQASNVKLLLNCNNILWNFANYPCAYMHKHSSRDTWQNLLRSPSKNLLIFWNLLDRSLIDSFIIFVTVYTFKC